MSRRNAAERFEEIERLVVKGGGLERQDASLPDTWVFWALQELYREYRAGYIDKETAKERKGLLRAAYDRAKLGESQYDHYLEVCKAYSHRSNKANRIQREILEAIQSEEADYKALLMEAVRCIGLLTGEDVTAQIVKARLTVGDYVDINVEEMEE